MLYVARRTEGRSRGSPRFFVFAQVIEKIETFMHATALAGGDDLIGLGLVPISIFAETVAVADIVGYENPKSKTDVTGVRVLTKDGFQFVRIAGSFGPSGNPNDAYSFIMVLRALILGEPGGWRP